MNVDCPNCGGQGWTTEHDTPASHYDGECHSCPVQAPCEYCQATGKVDYKRATPPIKGKD